MHISGGKRTRDASRWAGVLGRVLQRPLRAVDVVTVFGLALLLVLAPEPPSASALNFTGPSGGTGCLGNMADNRDHYVWNDSLSAATLDAANYVRVYTYNPTAINTFTEDVFTSQTDVLLRDYDYEGPWCNLVWRSSSTAVTGIVGYTKCLALSGSACQQFEVRFDNDWMGPKTTAQERWLACHELGHTVGLTHTSQAVPACMSPNDQLANPSTLTSHDSAHLTGYYS
jgi:hypothetical protein